MNKVSYTMLLALCFGLSLAPPTNATDIYKWIDNNGVPNFSEHPPEGVSFIKMKLRTGAAQIRTAPLLYTAPAVKQDKDKAAVSPAPAAVKKPTR